MDKGGGKGQINALHVHGEMKPANTVGGRRTWAVTSALAVAAGLAAVSPEIIHGASAVRVLTIWVVSAGVSYIVIRSLLNFGAALYRLTRR